MRTRVQNKFSKEIGLPGGTHNICICYWNSRQILARMNHANKAERTEERQGPGDDTSAQTADAKR